MLMRLRRPSILVLSTLLPASLALAACGGSDSNAVKGLGAVSISGPIGEAPKLDWKATMTAKKATSKVITKGKGVSLKKGDIVRVEFTMANGWTHNVSFDSYEAESLSTLVKVGTEKEPQSVTDLLSLGFEDKIDAGQTVGSRVAVSVGSETAFGDYLGSQAASLLAALDIGNEDGLLFVADIVGLADPQGTEEAAPAWAPTIVEKDGVPASLDFAKAPKPSGDLQVATLVKGTGPVVTEGQTILASYLGQLPDAKEPFDGNFGKGVGFEAVVGGKNAGVVKGWSKALVGLPVGSRVMIEIPPNLGYGEKGSGEKIPGGSTLYFVVDILDAADTKPEPEPEATDTAAPSEGAPSEGGPSTEPSTEPSTDASTQE